MTSSPTWLPQPAAAAPAPLPLPLPLLSEETDELMPVSSSPPIGGPHSSHSAAVADDADGMPPLEPPVPPPQAAAAEHSRAPILILVPPQLSLEQMPPKPMAAATPMQSVWSAAAYAPRPAPARHVPLHQRTLLSGSPFPSASAIPLSQAAMSTSARRPPPAAVPRTAVAPSSVAAAAAVPVEEYEGPKPPSYLDEFDDLADEDFLEAATQAEAALLAKPPPAAAAPAASAGSASTSSLYPRAISLLKQHWGFSSFRPGQFEVIDAVVSHKRDAYVQMSTGAGKSACFQLLPLLTDKCVVVISPLISLMQDQVIGLKARGIKAAALTSSEQDAAVTRAAFNGEYSLVFMSPERLASSYSDLQLLDRRAGITAFAIDESHCISEWGSDFRPEYRNLGGLRRHFPHVPIMALTATATRQVSSDIQQQLSMRAPFCLQTGLNRPNLYFEVRMATSIERDFTRELVGEDKASCIIYVQTKADTEAVAKHLQSKGIQACAYHAGLSPQARKEVHEAFLNERIRVVCATVAYGMGIDYAETRKVINYGMVKNIESLVQMTGRAGRDGQPAECIVMYSKADYSKAVFWKSGSRKAGPAMPIDEAERLHKSVTSKALDGVQGFLNSSRCRRVDLLEYFGEDWRRNAPPKGQAPKGVIASDGTCDYCDNCLAAQRLEQEAAMSAAGGPGAASPAAASRTPTLADIDTAHMYWWALAVHETGERFGLSWVSKFLKGSAAKQITDRQNWWRVRPLSASQAHGKLKAEPQAYTQALGRYLVNLDVLVFASSNDFTIVKLGPAGRRLIELGPNRHSTFKPTTASMNLTPELRGEIEAMRKVEELKAKNKVARAVATRCAQDAAAAHDSSMRSAAAANRVQADPLEVELLEALLDLRTSLAKERNCPPYTVFARSELDAFVRYRPTAVERMAKIGGVTALQLAQFAARFCHRIQQFATEKGLTTNLELPAELQQTPAMSAPSAAPSGSAVSYAEFIARRRSDDSLQTTACGWHNLPRGSLTPLTMPPVTSFQPTERPTARTEIWEQWSSGLDPTAIAQLRSVQVTTVLGYLATVISSGAGYEWSRFNIPDSGVDLVQAAILRAEAVSLQTGTSTQVLADPKDAGLWSVPFLKHIMAQLPRTLNTSSPTATPMDFGLLNLLVAHLRRVYREKGPIRAGVNAASPVVIDDDEDDLDLLSKPREPIDLSRFRSKFSPVKPASQPLDCPLSATTPSAPPTSTPALALPRRSLSEYLAQSQPSSQSAASSALSTATSAAASISPAPSPKPSLSTHLRPLYELSSVVDSSRALTYQKLKVLELFESGKTISQISSQCTLRTSTIMQFLADTLLHGYQLDWVRLPIASEDERVLMQLLPSVMPADAVRLPITALIPLIIQLKKEVREECTKETVLLVINKFIQQQQLQLHHQTAHTAAEADTDALASTPPVAMEEQVAPLSPSCLPPPLEHAPPIAMNSPTRGDSTATRATVTVGSGASSASSPLKRKANSFLTSAEKKQRGEDATDADGGPVISESTHTSPVAVSSPVSSQVRLVGSKHTAAPHPIRLLQQQQMAEVLPVKPSEAESTDFPLLPLSSESVLELLGRSSLRLEQLGERMIPTGPAMWSALSKLQAILNELAEGGRIFRREEQFVLMP